MFGIILSLLGIGTGGAPVEPSTKTLWDFEATSIDLAPAPLSQFKGQVALVVNVASKCGFTSQYEGLEALYAKYKDQGFVVLGFPSNDFGQQEPGSEKEIKDFCRLTYGVNFPMFKKGPVKGKDKQEIYKYLVSQSGGDEIGWNFNKFLVGRDGRVIDRYGSFTSPSSGGLKRAIEKALKAKRP